MSEARCTRAERVVMWLCVAALILSVLPLYTISFFNHPYYDDFGFSSDVHHVWQETGSLTAVVSQAIRSAQNVRNTWQGTYTGTLLSNLQPGAFDESLYFVGTFVLLTALLVCFAFFFHTLFRRIFSMAKAASVSLTCLILFLMVQFMPDVGEAFYWFNGGIVYMFICSLLALSLALAYRLYVARGAWRVGLLTALLALLMVALGGGSYSGGVMGGCLYALITLWLFVCKSPRKWHFLALWVVFLACFLYNVSAPGNSVRATMIGYKVSPVKAVMQALYYGAALIGGYIRLPVIAVSLLALPAMTKAARESRFRFNHPWLVLLAAYLLYSTQLTPPLYSIASMGGGRIMNVYYISFIALWFVCLYYMAGYAARRLEAPAELPIKARRGLALFSACLLLVGCLGFKRPSDALYGVQNLSGASAALSIVTGEALQYDQEMRAREALLNDKTQPVITLSPLSITPSVFMKDLLSSNGGYDTRPSLCMYYDKEAIHIEGSEDAK